MTASHLFTKAARRLFLVLASCGWFALGAPAQEGLDNVLATVGTTIQDPSGRTWAYLLWDASSPQMLLGRTFAVYAKPGAATNPAAYSRMAILAPQTDPRVIEPLLRRGLNLGDDLANLSSQLDGLFARLLPVSSLPVADKLSAVIRGSTTDAQYLQNLLLLARLHPGVGLACGVAYAQVVTNFPVTFELRAFEPAQNRDLGVVGRVTLSGAEERLPAPGRPFEVVDPSPKGNLNVKLRWATPEALRRAGPGQHGYNIWRVTKAFAESNAWHLTPPLEFRVMPNVAQRNAYPILSPRDFTEAEVGNFTPPTGDSNTVFFTDDDGQFEPWYSALANGFTNGAQFYYFVTARDILGRDGLPSAGTLVTVCDRMPPLPPEGLRVVNDYAFASADPQHLRVVWNQITNAADAITHYWIYRWQTVEEIFPAARDPSNHLVAVVAHTNGLAKNSFLDAGSGSPAVPANLGKTFWYTVRAQDSGACGPNLSANSGPAFGVLRDREGPEAPSGRIRAFAIVPVLSHGTTNWSNQGTPGYLTLTLNCTRTSSEIAYAAFTVLIQDQSNIVQTVASGPVYFPRDSSSVSFRFLCSGTNQGRTAVVRAVCATADNRRSATSQLSLFLDIIKLPPNVICAFEASLSEYTYTISAPGEPKHSPRDPGTVYKVPVRVDIYPNADSREYRVFRRVDGGEMTLLCQGLTLGVTNTCPDDSLPPNAAEICYFVQVLDQHGNPSPVTELGCIMIEPPRNTLPIPKLSPITSTNLSGNRGMVLRWFCPNAGVERFHVGIAGPLGSPIAPDLAAVTNFDGIAPASPTGTNLFIQVYSTPRLGSGFTNGPLFSAIPTNIQDGPYTVFIRAVARDGTCGEWSDPEAFVGWTPASAVEDILWPRRPLPGPAPSMTLTSVYLNNAVGDFSGGSVLIGSKVFSTNYSLTDTKEIPQRLIGPAEDPTKFVFSASYESLFPLAVYRCQVTNTAFPRVSGDIVQVTPLMENIAYQITATNSGGTWITNNTLLDPFILYQGALVPSDPSRWTLNVYLLDTQPVIRGARYRYLLVHFHPPPNMEMDYILPTTDMEVP